MSVGRRSRSIGGFRSFAQAGSPGGKPEALRGHRGPTLSLAEPREGLSGRSGAPRGVTRAGSARGEGSDASCGGQIARSRARGVSRRTPPRAPRCAQPPRQLPRFTLPPHHARRGPELGKKHAKGSARSGARARRSRRGDARGDRPRGGTGCIRGRGDVHGAIPRVRSPQTPRQLRRGGLDHPSPTNSRVNPEK